MTRLCFIFLFLPVLVLAQASFTKVTDPENALTQQLPIPSYNGVSWMDYNNDGWEDCFVNSNNLYRNNQDGTFEKVNFSPINFGGGNGAAWADYDGDGDLDVIIAAAPSFLYRNDVDSFAVAPISVEPIDTFNFWSATWGDYNGDGWVDLALIHPAGFIPFTNPISRTSLLLQNNQDGTFSKINSALDDELAAYTIGTWSDIDGDNDLDLLIGSGEVNFLSQDHIFLNKLKESGEATLERLSTGALAEDRRDGQNWNLIDYDLDGDLDAFVTNYNVNKPNDLYRNDNGTYVLQEESSVGSIVARDSLGLNNIWADFDNDGYQDCIVLFDGQNQDRYYRNNGDGTFTEKRQPFSIIAPTRGGSAGDYDNDGFMDLMISSVVQSAVGLYHNEGNDNHWLHLRLKGTAPNTAAIGAKVRVKAPINGNSVWQYREVNTQNTFNGHNSLRVHFGLAEATIIDSIEVTWPNGDRQIMTEVMTNQLCNLEEGQVIECEQVVNTSTLKPAHTYLKISPNPVQGNFIQAQFRFGFEGDTYWSIYDLTGRHRANYKERLINAGKDSLRIPVNNLKAGIYFLEIKRGNKKLQEGFIKAE